MVCLSRSRMSCMMWHLRQVADTGQKPGPTWARRSHPCLCLGSRSQEDLQVSRFYTALFLLTFSFHRDLVDFDTHLDDLSMVVFQLNVMFIKKFLLFSGLSQCWTEHGDWLLSLMTCAAAFKTCLVIITFIVQKCPCKNFLSQTTPCFLWQLCSWLFCPLLASMPASSVLMIPTIFYGW